MTNESILSDKEIHAHMSKIFGHERASSFLGGFALARAIEQAVLQAEQVQDWKRDAERWRYAMDWGTPGFAVCRRVGDIGVCWEPIKTNGPIDHARRIEGEHG